ncbi:hypothetical protein [Paracoccus benzoatiresistens]|uniref:Universal stress protein n=1 Tax=Paracoccus benzoatiresistens TaxID=2997341 RepID=A0ABT4J8E9_9RHOB|nr:hypothetical protein [Paracoccus sp. EF6]MCZ0963409.1 hypothetical protein [Paracoccus sp. EF6]
MAHRIAYIPLDTYPEPLPDTAILAATGFAASLGCNLHVSTFAVTLPAMTSPLGGYLLDAKE